MINVVGGMYMNYMILKELRKNEYSFPANKDYCVNGRIPGAVKMAGV